ncbi:uncharacterized protein TNCV_1388301 [Trichonephila clavipes]|nr:uncharacterized protein TNCV_1388301 [Trichonephila clavipes]
MQACDTNYVAEATGGVSDADPVLHFCGRSCRDLARQIHLEVESDDVQELLDSHNHELTIDELIEIHEQEQDIEELECLNPVQSEDIMTLSSDLFSVWFGNSSCIDSRLNNAFRFVEWAQNEIAVVPDFHKRILFSDEAHFWLNGYVNKQNCRIWSEANPQVYVETSLHPEKLTVWCALWAGGILLQKR